MINYSIIIPHKNTPELLERCINSIPERDDIQIIVVDDNSDDGKKPKLQREGVEIFLLDEVQSNGAGHARNVGLEHAKGKWLLFADADDYYKDGFLDILDDYIERETDVLYFNFEYKDGKTGDLIQKFHYNKYFEDYDGSKLSSDLIKFHIKVPWTKMVQRAYVLKNNIKYEETINGNDIFFSLCVGYYAQNIHVDKRPVYVYLKNQNSLVNSKKKSKSSHICQIKHCIQLNAFYDFIGYPEWRISVIKRTINHIKEYGLALVFSLILHTFDFISCRKEWVLFFKD